MASDEYVIDMLAIRRGGQQRPKWMTTNRAGKLVVFLIVLLTTTTMTSEAAAIDADADQNSPYSLNTCICRLDSNLRQVLADAIARQQPAVDPAASSNDTSSNQTATITTTASGYIIPTRSYSGVLFSTPTDSAVCNCLTNNVFFTKITALNRQWAESMKDPSSVEFQAMSNELELQFDETFLSSPFADDYVTSYLTRLERGPDGNSTVATVDVQWSRPLDAELVRQYFFKVASRRQTPAKGPIRVLTEGPLDAPYFAPVAKGSSGRYAVEDLATLLKQAREIAWFQAPKPKTDRSSNFFYWVTCPALAGLGAFVLICLCGLSAKGCLCRNKSPKKN